MRSPNYFTSPQLTELAPGTQAMRRGRPKEEEENG